MTNSKHTKRALFSSVIALILCFSMLIGTTFAWFTDSVTGGINTIAAGNLDVEIYNSLTVGENKVVSTTKLFDHITYWEPGVVAYENLTIANMGTLALKYQMSINFDNATTNANGDTLAKVLKVGFVEGGIKSTTRDGALTEVKAWQSLESFVQSGDLLKGENDVYGIVIYWAPSDIDNEFNMNNDNRGKVMSIDLGINLQATQLMAESDSFGKDYDANAILPWDGTANDAWYDPDKSEYILYTAEDLAGLATLINGGNNLVGKTVKLGADIDLAGRRWTPINLWFPEGGNNLVIDGNGHKISNMIISANGNNAGFISGMTGNVTIQNLTFEKASVVSSGNFIGTVVGYQYGNLVLNNVDVVNSEVSSSAAIGIRIGGLVGFSTNDGTSPATIKLENCDVSGTTIMGYHNLGGLVGTQMNTNYTYTNCSVKGCTIYARTTTEKYVDEIAVDGGTFDTEYTATVENNKVICGAISNAAQLAALSAARISGTYVLAADIDMNGADFSAMIVNRSTSATFQGNGHTISNVNIISGADDNTTGQASMFYVYSSASLTVSDLTLENITATADAVDSGYAAAVIGYCEGTAELNNVDVVKATLIAPKSSGMLVGHLSGSLTATNCDVTGAITLTNYEDGGHYAGEYVGSVAGNAALTDCTANVTIGGNLNSKNVGTIYGRKVRGNLTIDGQQAASTQGELESALAEGKNVVLADDIEMEASTTAPYGNKYGVALNGGVLDGNNNELVIECYGDDYGIMTTGGTIKNLTIEEGCRAVMIMYATEDIILDNVTIGGDGVLYPINTGETGPNGSAGIDLIVTNSTLKGWTSYGNAIESASFTNVKFEQGTYYNNIYGRVLKPYVNTTLTDCSFVEHMNLDLSALLEGQKVTIANCTVNGQAVTADVFTIPTTDAEYDTELFTVDLPSWATDISDCIIFK